MATRAVPASMFPARESFPKDSMFLISDRGRTMAAESRYDHKLYWQRAPSVNAQKVYWKKSVKKIQIKEKNKKIFFICKISQTE